LDDFSILKSQDFSHLLKPDEALLGSISGRCLKKKSLRERYGFIEVPLTDLRGQKVVYFTKIHFPGKNPFANVG